PAVRAQQVVDPRTTTARGRGRVVMVRALSSGTGRRVEYTQRRGHAAELARLATEERVDVVIALGGDGTVNEVVNGMLRDGPGERGPALAGGRGGARNAFARAARPPNDSGRGTWAGLGAPQ